MSECILELERSAPTSVENKAVVAAGQPEPIFQLAEAGRGLRSPELDLALALAVRARRRVPDGKLREASGRL